MAVYRTNDLAHQKLQIGDESNATLYGGAGAYDTLVAGNGDNLLLQAGTGSHTLLICGNGHGNRLIGGSGASDTLVGGDGGCTFKAGTGAKQVMRGGAADDVFNFDQFGANDTVEGGAGHNRIVFAHDSKHVQVELDASGYAEVTFTDISKTVWVRNVATLVFNDGQSRTL